MRLMLLLVLLCSTLIVAIDDIESTEKPGEASTKSSTKDENNKSETIKPFVSEVCKKCDCQVEAKTVDCQDLKIENIFSDEEFSAFNDSNVPQDIFRLNNNELTIVRPFPVLSIKILNLHRNKISKIDKGAFMNLHLLEELDLSSNELTAKTLLPDVFDWEFSTSTIEPLQNLKILRLGHNQLHALNQDLFEHLTSLEVLSLDSNPILTIDHLTAIAISDLPNLKFNNINYTSMRYHFWLFKNGNLKSTQLLRWKYIKCERQFLDMSYLELTEIPRTLFNSPHELNTLNLTGNSLKKIPEALEFAVNLQTLFLDENDIQCIGGNDAVFPALKKLEFLSISYTTLESIGEGAFSKLTALKTLMITNNHHLSVIHPMALSKNGLGEPHLLEYPPLTNLYLRDNNLTTLDEKLFSDYENMDIIDIRHNPWVCRCENQWLISNLLPIIIGKHPTMSKDLVCFEPMDLVGIELSDWLNSNRTLRCKETTPQGGGTILVGILIGIFIGIPMSLAIVFVYKRGCFGLSRNRSALTYSRAFHIRTDKGDDFRI